MLMNVAGVCQHGGVGSLRDVFFFFLLMQNVVEPLSENVWNLVIPTDALYQSPENVS